MGQWQGKSRRKITGGILRIARKKRKFEISREKQHTYIGEPYVKKYRVRGANVKLRLMQTKYANVTDPTTKVTKKVEIITVKENPANPHYVQRNILTKGATIQTTLGLARVTSRAGQDGVLNAVLIK